MVTKELIDFVKTKKSEKIPDTDIKRDLFEMGWRESDVRFALKHYDTTTPIPPYDNEKVSGGQKEKWDSFMHTLMFISMYVSLVSFIIMVFMSVDFIFGQKLGGGSYYSSRNYAFGSFLDDLRAPLSWFIVSFPIFLYLFKKIAERTKENPEIRNLTSRKQLIYATLTITFVTVLICAIILVDGLLKGDFALNNIIKMVYLMLFCGLIFTYYLKQVKEDRSVII